MRLRTHGAQRLDLSRHRHALRMVHKEAPRNSARCTILGGVPRPLALCPPSQVLDVRQAVRRDAAVGLEDHRDSDPRALHPLGVVVVALLRLYPSTPSGVVEGAIPGPPSSLAAEDLQPELLLGVAKGILMPHRRRRTPLLPRPTPDASRGIRIRSVCCGACIGLRYACVFCLWIDSRWDV